jgi:hypothetical protein
MAVPPELMALLQGGGGAPPGGGDPAMMGGDPSMGGPPPMEEEAGPSALYGGGGLGGDNTEALRAALDSLAAYSEGEDDEQNIQIVLKCVTALQAILAEEQKMVDGAMGGKADPRALRKLGGASGGAGGGPQY